MLAFWTVRAGKPQRDWLAQNLGFIDGKTKQERDLHLATWQVNFGKAEKGCQGFLHSRHPWAPLPDIMEVRPTQVLRSTGDLLKDPIRAMSCSKEWSCSGVCWRELLRGTPLASSCAPLTSESSLVLKFQKETELKVGKKRDLACPPSPLPTLPRHQSHCRERARENPVRP